MATAHCSVTNSYITPYCDYPLLGKTGLGRFIDEHGDANANISVFAIQPNYNSTWNYTMEPIAIIQNQRGKLVGFLFVCLFV